jgi:hypothetical protein
MYAMYPDDWAGATEPDVEYPQPKPDPMHEWKRSIDEIQRAIRAVVGGRAGWRNCDCPDGDPTTCPCSCHERLHRASDEPVKALYHLRHPLNDGPWCGGASAHHPTDTTTTTCPDCLALLRNAQRQDLRGL